MKHISLCFIGTLLPTLCFGMQIKQTKKPYMYCEGSISICSFISTNNTLKKTKDKRVKLDPSPSKMVKLDNPLCGFTGKYKAKNDYYP
jgi:hypothetical protein